MTLKPRTRDMDLFREKLSHTFSSLKGVITLNGRHYRRMTRKTVEVTESWVSEDISLRSTMGRAHRETFFMTLEASTASSQAGSEGDQGESLRLVGWRIRGRNVQRWNDFLRAITGRSFNFACRCALYNIGIEQSCYIGGVN